jgi:hypothetical protein
MAAFGAEAYSVDRAPGSDKCGPKDGDAPSAKTGPCIRARSSRLPLGKTVISRKQKVGWLAELDA